STSTTTGTTSSGVSELEGSRSGIATFYGGNWDGGACLFTDYPQGSWNGTAISSTQWFGSAACGACLEVTGSSGTVTVMVVDECPECDENHLDLFEDIATTVDANAATDGEFDITWELVPCAVTGNMQFKNKSGASAYWFAMQVRNTVVPVDSLEVSIDGGSTWTSVEREDYNFFVYSSGFGSSVDIRVTSMTGEQITQSDVEVSDGLIVEGSSQF
ncbi:Non-catalytic module family EXPN protein, partial [Fistulina hepatica ATCC 64428]